MICKLSEIDFSIIVCKKFLYVKVEHKSRYKWNLLTESSEFQV